MEYTKRTRLKKARQFEKLRTKQLLERFATARAQAKNPWFVAVESITTVRRFWRDVAKLAKAELLRRLR